MSMFFCFFKFLSMSCNHMKIVYMYVIFIDLLNASLIEMV